MDSVKDMRGVDIHVGDYVVYGKSNRNYPISIGTIVKVEDNGALHVLGDNNKKVGILSCCYHNRVLVLPENYR